MKDLGYKRRHERLRYHRGSAKQHVCVDCGGSRHMEWSQIKGTDGEDPFDYEPRCKKCHHAYDREQWEEGMALRDTANISTAATQMNKERWQDPEWRAKMSAAVAESNRRRAAASRAVEG